MGTLNIVNKSPFEKRTLDQCIKRIGAGDSVLLIEDASVSAISGTEYQEPLLGIAANTKLYVLQPDLAARGFAEATLIDSAERVDYAGFR